MVILVLMKTNKGNEMKTITKKKAMVALKEHGNNSFRELKDFINDLGNKKIYYLKDVKNWLGY